MRSPIYYKFLYLKDGKITSDRLIAYAAYATVSV